MLRSIFANLRFRLLLLVFLAVIPPLGLTFYANGELRRMAAADTEREALRLAKIVASDQRDAIKDARQLIFALAQLPEVHSADPAACSTFLARLLEEYPQYAFFGVATREGNLFCSAPATDDPINLANRACFEGILQARDFTLSECLGDQVTGKATLDFGYPIFDAVDRVEAVIFASLDLSWLNQLAAEVQLPENSTFTVAAHEGTILVHYPDPDAWVGRAASDSPIMETILARREDGTVEAYGVDGTLRLFAFAPVNGITGSEEIYVSVGIPTAVAFADANRLLTRNLIALGLVTILALVAAWFGSDVFVLRRVNKLAHATEQLSAGDLHVRIGEPYEGKLGQLGQAFDEMAQSLERRVAERDAAEKALRESQRALSTLMSNLPGMAYRCRNDWERTMEFVSEGCFDLTGYSPSELVGGQRISYGDLIHPDDRESVWAEMQTALREGMSFQITYRIITAGGEEKWAWEQGRAGSSSGDSSSVLEGLIIDATERVLTHRMLEQRITDRSRELSVLYDVMAVVNASLDLETILHNSLDRVLALMGCQVGAIHLLEKTRGVLCLAASHGIPADIANDIESVPVGNSLAGRVVEKDAPLVVPVIANGPQSLPVLPAAANQTYLGVPVRARGEVLGVLSLIGKTGRQFSNEEVSLLVSIADEVGVAVENARLYRQAEQLAIVKERERLARELHDSVTQSLYSLTLLSEAGRQLAAAGDFQYTEKYLGRVGEISQQALKEMRLLVYELRPLVLQQEGLVGALQQRLDAVEKRAGVDAQLVVEGKIHLSMSAEEALYRVAQEALNNALKHAAPTRVTVCVRAKGDQVELEVIDNGKGFDPYSVGDKGGMGLVNIRERVEKLGGTLEILSRPAEGTDVRVVISGRMQQRSDVSINSWGSLDER